MALPKTFVKLVAKTILLQIDRVDASQSNFPMLRDNGKKNGLCGRTLEHA